jgi:hypothetical protein
VEPLEEEPPESRWGTAIGFTLTLAFALGVGYFIGLRGLELVGIATGGLLLIIGLEKVADRLQAWIRR